MKTYNKNVKCPICDSDKIDNKHYYGDMGMNMIFKLHSIPSFRKCIECGFAWCEESIAPIKKKEFTDKDKLLDILNKLGISYNFEVYDNGKSAIYLDSDKYDFLFNKQGEYEHTR